MVDSGSLFIWENGEVQVVPGISHKARDEARRLIGCEYLGHLPSSVQIDRVRGPNGKVYRYDLWVDDLSILKGLDYNPSATYAGHPLALSEIYGPALLTPWK